MKNNGLTLKTKLLKWMAYPPIHVTRTQLHYCTVRCMVVRGHVSNEEAAVSWGGAERWTPTYLMAFPQDSPL